MAPTDSTVLIQGESGTGKEVIARYIHDLSNRADGPFLSINCGALPENLLESELFGHVKGRFTGAVRDKQGLFAAARGGSFFLDEVGEMPPSLQVKLLRVLQEREAIPVGATEAIPVDVRIIAATNRDLEEEIRRGNFRCDLYYRLNVIALNLPPLRERRDDLLLLLEEFLQTMAQEPAPSPRRSPSEALDAVMVYEWPGNVRELENALEHAVVLSRGNLIEAGALPERITKRRKEPLVAERSYRNPTLEVIERAYIMWVLQAEGGNKTRAAEVLGIDPSTLYRKLSRYEEQVEVEGVRRLLPPALVALVAFAVFTNTLSHQFVYDDNSVIVENPRVHQLTNWREIVTSPWWPRGLYRPVTSLTLAANWTLDPGEPSGFHLVNVLLHAIAAALVAVLGARLMGMPGGLAAGLLFAVHPVHVEAVANVVGRAEVLATVFALVAALAYLRFGDLTGTPEGTPLRRGLAAAGTITGTVLALGPRSRRSRSRASCWRWTGPERRPAVRCERG